MVELEGGCGRRDREAVRGCAGRRLIAEGDVQTILRRFSGSG